MQVFINNKETTISENTTLIGFLEKQNLVSTRGIAIAINDVVVPKSTWAKRTLEPESRILIIKAAQGG